MKSLSISFFLAALILGLPSCVTPNVQGTGSVEALERQNPVPDAPNVREGEAARAASYYATGGPTYYRSFGRGRW